MGCILMEKFNGTSIFAGCSFTWGQGLWSYWPSKKWYVPKVNEYLENAPIPPEADEFRISNRFANLVANHNFNDSKPLVKRHNGGTDDESIRFIKHIKYDNWVGNGTLQTINVDWRHVHSIFFQTTQLYRSPFFFFYKGEEYSVRADSGFHDFSIVDKIHRDDKGISFREEEQESIDIFLDWLIDNNLTPEDFVDLHTKNMIDRIEELFKECESDGKKVYIFSWTDEYLEEIKSRKYFDNKFIPIRKFDTDETFECIQHLMEKYPNFEIQNDKTKIHDCGGDAHPSLECHKIIEHSINDYINE